VNPGASGSICCATSSTSEPPSRAPPPVKKGDRWTLTLTRLAGTLFDDIGKETVEFRPNYDGTEQEPTVLPAPFPLLLVNGVEGIAVGMAASMPPHNLCEVVGFVKALCANPQAPLTELLALLPAPDFPTGGIVYDIEGMADAIELGRGKIRLRAKWHEEERKRGGASLIIDEIPYAQNKASLVAKIADLVRNKEVEDVAALRDESSKEGLRIALDLKAGASAEVVFAQLAAKTDLDTSVSYNCRVLDSGMPEQLGLRSIALKWIEFRQQTILQRHIYERKQALARLHILKGYMAAIGMLDQVVALIRASRSIQEARDGLIALLTIDEAQAQAILDLRLQKLTNMELAGIQEDHDKHVALVEQLSAIIESPQRVRAILLEELDGIAKAYGKGRSSVLGEGLSLMTREDLVPKEDVIIVMTRGGYIKRMSATALAAQNRGTRGKRLMDLGEDDEISAIYNCNSHALLLVFAENGQVYGCKAWRIPEAAATSKGRHIRNVIEGLEEEIRSIVAVPTDDPEVSIVTVSRRAQIKRTSIGEYEGATRKSGIRGLSIDEGDGLLEAFAVRAQAHMMLISRDGRAIRFNIEDVRLMGRTAGGVRGMRLEAGEHLVGAYSVPSTGEPLPLIKSLGEDGKGVERPDTTGMDAGKFLLCVGERGVGKRTSVSEFPLHNRGGKGVIAFNINRKTGPLVCALGAQDDMDVVMFASNGVSNRIRVSDVRETGRAAAGVHLMTLDDGATLVKAIAALRQDEPASEAATVTESA
jgi:DNA gyrase subunit A